MGNGTYHDVDESHDEVIIVATLTKIVDLYPWVDVYDLFDVRLETDAMVVLFSNLLDNAIEACHRSEVLFFW